MLHNLRYNSIFKKDLNENTFADRSRYNFLLGNALHLLCNRDVGYPFKEARGLRTAMIRAKPNASQDSAILETSL